MSDPCSDPFLRACGAAGPLRLTVEEAGAVAEVALWHPYARVGRSPSADVRVASAAAGRRHLYFQVLGGRLLCMDLHGPSGRRQGLYPRSGWFGPRHAVRVGAATLRLARGCE